MNKKNINMLIALIILIIGVVALGYTVKKKKGGWLKNQEKQEISENKVRSRGSMPAALSQIPEPDSQLPNSPQLPPLRPRL